MSLKQILFIGGGSVSGALAAVLLMKSQTPDPPNVDQQPADQPSAVSAPETAGDGSVVKSDRVIGAGAVLGGLAGADQTMDAEEAKNRREEFRNSMKERQMERLTSKMAQWSAALGLDEAQQEDLLEIASQQLDELDGLADGASRDSDPAALSESAKRAMAIVSGRALEDSMAAVLTPEQQQKFEEFGERQTQSRAEAQTLRQLAGLQEDLMLTPAQRNDVYAVLYENSLETVKEDSDVGSMIETFASQSGLTIDPSMQGVISKIASEGLEGLASGKKLDGDSLKEMAESAAADSINQQVEQLRPVLTEGQLELYRSQLESRIGNLMKLGRSGR